MPNWTAEEKARWNEFWRKEYGEPLPGYAEQRLSRGVHPHGGRWRHITAEDPETGKQIIAPPEWVFPEYMTPVAPTPYQGGEPYGPPPIPQEYQLPSAAQEFADWAYGLREGMPSPGRDGVPFVPPQPSPPMPPQPDYQAPQEYELPPAAQEFRDWALGLRAPAPEPFIPTRPAPPMPPGPPREVEGRFEEYMPPPTPEQAMPTHPWELPEWMARQQAGIPPAPLGTRDWRQIAEWRGQPPVRAVERPEAELVEQGIERGVERLWPGWTEAVRREVVEPAKELWPGLQRDMAKLLGSMNAQLHGVDIRDIEVPELETPGQLFQAAKGFYGNWFAALFDIMGRVDTAKNAVVSVMNRVVQHTPLQAQMSSSIVPSMGAMPFIPPTVGVSEELQKEIEAADPITREAVEEAVHEAKYVWDFMAMLPSTREEIRDRVRSGELTLEEAMKDYHSPTMTAILDIATSPWWFLGDTPASRALMKVGFAPITVPLKVTWAVAKKTPLIKHLVSWSKMTRVNRTGQQAVDAVDKMMRESVPGPRDMPFTGGAKSMMQVLADDFIGMAEGGAEALAERFPHLNQGEIASLQKILQGARVSGIDPAYMFTTAMSKEQVLSRVRWMAKLQKAAELGISLERDVTIGGEARAMLIDLWLSASTKYIANNTMDDMGKAAMHGVFPSPFKTNYVERAGEYGWALPEMWGQSQLAQLRGGRLPSFVGRVGVPGISRPEHWATGYGASFLEGILGKRAANRLVSKTTSMVGLLDDPNAGLLKRFLKGVLDNANVESFFAAGREVNYRIQHGIRSEILLTKGAEHINLARGSWVDDVLNYADELGYSADEIARLRGYLNSPLVKSVDDVTRRANLALGGTEEAIVYGLAEHEFKQSGKLAGPLQWVADDLLRLEEQGRATAENVQRTFKVGRRMVDNVISAADDVAKGRTPVSNVLDDVMDIRAIQAGRRHVAHDYARASLTEIEKAYKGEQIVESAWDDARQIYVRAATSAEKYLSRAWEQTDDALRSLQDDIEELKQLRDKGVIGLDEFAGRYSQKVAEYKWGKQGVRPLWDKVNDKVVKIYSAASHKMQRAAGVYPEPLSAELSMQLARYQTIESRIQQTFKQNFLGKIINDAEGVLDELARWEDEALGKLIPEERVAEAVGRIPKEEIRRVIETQDLVKQRSGLQTLADEYGLTFEEARAQMEKIYPGFSKQLMEPWELTRKEYVGRQIGFLERPQLEQSHREAVERAIAEGRAIPSEVLADYPDLAKLAPTAEAVAPEVGRAMATPETRAQLIDYIRNGWQGVLDEGKAVGNEMVDHILFNYGDKTVAEQLAQNPMLPGSVPFVTWQIRNPLYWLQHFQEVPGALNAIRLFEVASDEYRQERGLTARFKWTVPVTDAFEFIPGMPEGYYGMDLRPLVSVTTQLGIYAPFGEPFQWSEETSAGKLMRAGEWLGMSSYPWWRYMLSKVGIGETPDLAYIAPITRAVRDWTGIDIGHVTEIEQYYAALELAGRVAIGEIDKADALKAINEGMTLGIDNRLFNDALEVTQDANKRIDRIAMWLPFAIKYASPKELAVRERLQEFRGLPEEEEIEWEEWPGVSTHFFIWASPEDQQRLLAYEEKGERRRQLNRSLLSLAQGRRVGDAGWRIIMDDFWGAVDELNEEYSDLIPQPLSADYGMGAVFCGAAQTAVKEYRAVSEPFLDETGELKEGHEWGDVVAAQEEFRAGLVMGWPERPPVSLDLFDQAFYRWESPALAKLRAWERLYARPVYKVIAETGSENPALIDEAKRIADGARNNDAELMAEILRVHPDWTKQEVKDAMAPSIARWDTWSRRYEPVRPALYSAFWQYYSDPSIPKRTARDEAGNVVAAGFWDVIEERVGPEVTEAIKNLLMDKETRAKMEKQYGDPIPHVSTFTLVEAVDALGALAPFIDEGRAEEIKELMESYGITPIPEIENLESVPTFEETLERQRLAPPWSEEFRRPGVEEEPEARGRPPGMAAPPMPEAPVPYSEEINTVFEDYPDVTTAIEEGGYDPLAFIAAIIQIESSNKPDAVNPESGAAGLMQVMPYTSTVPSEELLVAETGIAEGVRDLNAKLANNEGDLYEAMFDYSGGPRQEFQGKMVGWESKEDFDAEYWQPLMAAYEELAAQEPTALPTEEPTPPIPTTPPAVPPTEGLPPPEEPVAEEPVPTEGLLGPTVERLSPELAEEQQQATAEMAAFVEAKEAGAEAEWTPLMEKWYGDPDSPSGQFWDIYREKLPPGPRTKEIRNDPLIGMIIDKATRGYIGEEGYEEANERLSQWIEEHPEAIVGEPEEWEQVRDILARYGEAKEQGLDDKARAIWEANASLLVKYGYGAGRRAMGAGAQFPWYWSRGPKKAWGEWYGREYGTEFGQGLLGWMEHRLARGWQPFGGGPRETFYPPSGPSPYGMPAPREEGARAFHELAGEGLMENLMGYWAGEGDLYPEDIKFLEYLYKTYGQDAGSFEEWLEILKSRYYQPMPMRPGPSPYWRGVSGERR